MGGGCYFNVALAHMFDATLETSSLHEHTSLQVGGRAGNVILHLLTWAMLR